MMMIIFQTEKMHSIILFIHFFLQIDFAYLVWESFSERLIGFSARDHYFDNHEIRRKKVQSKYYIIQYCHCSEGGRWITISRSR